METTTERSRRFTQLRNSFNQGKVAESGHPHILLASMPGGGATLVSLIAGLPQIRRVELIRGGSRREQELSLEQCTRNHDRGYVAEANVRYSASTQRFIDAFSMTVVLQVRNLYDVVESFHDELLDVSTVTPITYVPDEFATWSRQRRLMFVADTAVPWCLSFFRTWQEFQSPKVTVAYDGLIRDPAAVLQTVIEGTGIAATEPQASAAVAILEARLQSRSLPDVASRNGRAHALPATVRKRVDQLAAYHSGADLSLIL